MADEPLLPPYKLSVWNEKGHARKDGGGTGASGIEGKTSSSPKGMLRHTDSQRDLSVANGNGVVSSAVHPGFCVAAGFLFFFGINTKGGFGVDTVAVKLEPEEKAWGFNAILGPFRALGGEEPEIGECSAAWADSMGALGDRDFSHKKKRRR